MTRFEPAFDAPSVRSGFATLVALADAVRKSASVLADAETDPEDAVTWVKCVSVLSRTLEAHLTVHVDPAVGLRTVWDGFFSSADLTAMSQPLQDAWRAIAELADVSNAPADYVEGANTRGHVLAQRILERADAADLLQGPPWNVAIGWEHQRRHACAGTARTIRQLRWVLRPREEALLAVLVAEWVFAHEYVSHAAPASEYLPDVLAEGWLVELLGHALREQSPAAAAWQSRIWYTLRAIISRRDGVPYDDDLLVREVASTIAAVSPEAFWRMTRTMLQTRQADVSTLEANFVKLCRSPQSVWIDAAKRLI